MSNRSILLIVILLLTFTLSNKTEAQVFLGDWFCEYATWDAQPNATGYNTASVAVVSENKFVAIIKQRGVPGANYLVGYVNADSMNGRLGHIGEGSAMQGGYQEWINGFDVVTLADAYDIAAGPDGKIYVANNDPDRNILVFNITENDSAQIATLDFYTYVTSAPYRMSTGTDPIWSIDVDNNGYVYVTVEGNDETPGKVLVYKGIGDDTNWEAGHNSEPVAVINMDEPGFVNGIAVNGDGSLIYTSNYSNKNVYCYTGSPLTGYTKYNGFNFELTSPFIHPDFLSDTVFVGPLGMGFMNDKNVLLVAADQIFRTGAGYRYGRVYALNPNTGDSLSCIDAAEWNFAQTGGYNTRPGGTFGTASGYTSLYNLDVDENFNVYTQSYYGWTVDKWSFSGVIPIIPILILNVEKDETGIPTDFGLNQNYPNPFNPTTTITFSINEESNVSLNVYSVSGELVTELIKNNQMSAGNYRITFDASKLASGTYIYTLTNGTKTESKKMKLVK